MMLTHIVSKARREEWCTKATCRWSPKVSEVASDLKPKTESSDATRRACLRNRFGEEVGRHGGGVGDSGDRLASPPCDGIGPIYGNGLLEVVKSLAQNAQAQSAPPKLF